MPEDYDRLSRLKGLEAALNTACIDPGSAETTATTSELEAIAARMVALTAREDLDEGRANPAVQLPIWPEPARAQANTLLRSALFGANQRRRMVRFGDNTSHAAWGGLKLQLTGETMNQFDENVWMQLVHLWKQQGEPQDFIVRFKARAFLRSLGKKHFGGRCVELVRTTISRLSGTVVHLQGELSDRERNALGGMLEYGGNLIEEYFAKPEDGFFAVRLNPKFLRLFGAGHTRFDWETRLRLPLGLASWLHRYILSHRATAAHPHRDSVARLKELSGSRTTDKQFRFRLKRAMNVLQKEGVVLQFGWTTNGALEFVRPQSNALPSPS